MRLALSLIGLSFSAALCASAHAQTPSPAAPASAYDEQAVGVRNLGGTSASSPPASVPAGCTPRKVGRVSRSDHHPIDQEAFFRIVGREDLLFRYQNRAAIKTAVKVSGGALILGGLVFAEIAHFRREAAATTRTHTLARAPAVPPPITPA